MQQGWRWPRIFAHRCGGALAPENTCAGLDVSAALGVGGVEFDVMLSADGRPVVIHDEELDRTTTARGPVRARSFAELTACDAGSRHHPAFAGELLPSLQRVAKTCQRLGLAANIEIKCSDAEGRVTGSLVAREAARLWQGCAALPLLSSFSVVALEAARSEAPQLPRALLLGEVPADWQTLFAELACVAVHSDVTTWSEALVREIRGRGAWLAGYTENDPMRARRWFDAGANALFTDRPDLLRGLETGNCGHVLAEPP